MINNSNPMCFIFDVVSPAMKFKCDMDYDADEDFPEAGDSGEVTETDDEDVQLMPYNPVTYPK